ncbi:MAG: hypothetical protein ABIH26_15880 [Candidatus Eisenbacteria bacterium]
MPKKKQPRKAKEKAHDEACQAFDEEPSEPPKPATPKAQAKPQAEAPPKDPGCCS